MGLSEYRRKLDLSKTPEPRGEVVEEQRKSPPLRFVVQKHAARRLHYDFRGDERRPEKLGDTKRTEPRLG
jgi:hypothetical protein